MSLLLLVWPNRESGVKPERGMAWGNQDRPSFESVGLRRAALFIALTAATLGVAYLVVIVLS